jgi:hypothetical protein
VQVEEVENPMVQEVVLLGCQVRGELPQVLVEELKGQNEAPGWPHYPRRRPVSQQLRELEGAGKVVVLD